MIIPVRDPKTHDTTRRTKQGEPFDPDDLTRRLNAHIAAQQRKAEHRLSARAKATALAYYHVPKVAAATFEKTTTQHGPARQLHRLSQPVLRTHRERCTLDEPIPGQQLRRGLKGPQALDMAVLDRALLGDRNQFQRCRAMEDAARVDVYRGIHRSPPRSFREPTSPRGSNETRPMGRGSVYLDGQDPNGAALRGSMLADEFEDCNDWVQLDGSGLRDKKEGTSMLVRRKESRWTLGKWSPKQGKDEPVVVKEEGPLSATRTVKMSFLAKFKR